MTRSPAAEIHGAGYSDQEECDRLHRAEVVKLPN
jgi:hypothetical protein